MKDYEVCRISDREVIDIITAASIEEALSIMHESYISSDYYCLIDSEEN